MTQKSKKFTVWIICTLGSVHKWRKVDEFDTRLQADDYVSYHKEIVAKPPKGYYRYKVEPNKEYIPQLPQDFPQILENIKQKRDRAYKYYDRLEEGLSYEEQANCLDNAFEHMDDALNIAISTLDSLESQNG